MLTAVLGLVLPIAGAYWGWKSFDDRRQAKRRAAFVDTRTWLNSNRGALTRRAQAFYPDEIHVADTTLIADGDWLGNHPVDFEEVALEWTDQSPTPAITGQDVHFRSLLPISESGSRFKTYCGAVQELDAPELFVDRPSYRLVGVGGIHAGKPKLKFSRTSYFEMLNVCEALAFETAQDDPTRPGGSNGTAGRLRRHAGDLLDLGRRPVLPSINTLTLRKDADGSASYFLHLRGSKAVSTASGLYHVIPAGVFQPASRSPGGFLSDLDLWRSTMREYSEEMLGSPEITGDEGMTIDYAETEPFKSLVAARAEGRIRPFFFGLALDPLTPAGEFLTTVVFDHDAFDEIFGPKLVKTNDEGRLIGVQSGAQLLGLPFTQAAIDETVRGHEVAAAAQGCLQLSMKHREELLA